jgi:hypothetical protein
MLHSCPTACTATAHTHKRMRMGWGGAATPPHPSFLLSVTSLTPCAVAGHIRKQPRVVTVLSPSNNFLESSTQQCDPPPPPPPPPYPYFHISPLLPASVPPHRPCLPSVPPLGSVPSPACLCVTASVTLCHPPPALLGHSLCLPPPSRSSPRPARPPSSLTPDCVSRSHVNVIITISSRLFPILCK